MTTYEDEIFKILEDSIKDVEIEEFNIYNVCTEQEKLKVFKNKGDNWSFKVFKNSILLKYYKMKKIDDAIEIRNINNISEILKNKFSNIKCNDDNSYLRISIHNINDIRNISNDLGYIFKLLFLQYISNEESFGCCSKYIECSDNLKCVHDNIRFRVACMYKKNLDNGKIFYGKNKNV